MRLLGIVLMVVGVLFGLVALQMDTTTTTEGKNFGYGISIPSMTVNNIGLMEERRNKLMVAGVLVLVGAIFTAMGGKSKSESSAVASNSDLIKCTYCAEMIKSEAVICRFCGKDVPEKPKPPILESYNLKFEHNGNISCPQCNSIMRLDAKEIQAKKFECADCKAEINYTVAA